MLRRLVPEDLGFYHTLQQHGHCKFVQGDHIGGALSNAKKEERGGRAQNYKAACPPYMFPLPPPTICNLHLSS